ncbi:hypothetical protein M514_26805 [Trichuris suis]|uniref:CCHC-type domain-containing protein n=1 Tax=Trichuris suis TaxID=68888 RepID=A0A085MUV2_9BILA|nr:hypothetical protein M514_26805 [Trichuris suis]
MSKEERSGRKGAVAGPPGPATIGDRGRICDSSQQFTAGFAGHIALPTLSSSTENVGLWFERMEDYFELTETPQKKLPLLKFYLDDTLRRVLPALNVSSSDDYESARAKLLSYLGGEKDPRIVRGQFFSRIQKAQEKTSAYMMELRRLSMSAFPHVAVKETDALVIDQFARGLSSKAIKAAVVRARCTSAEEALEAATCEESDLQVLHEVTASVRSLETREQHPPVGSGTPAKINELAERILDAVGQRSRAAGKQNPLSNGDHPQGPDKSVSKGMICFNCGGRDHRAKHCPSPRTKSATNRKTKIRSEKLESLLCEGLCRYSKPPCR